MLPELDIPLVAAPMAGGPSTSDLVVAVGDSGGLGFLGAGYKTTSALQDEMAEVRRRTQAPFGVNVFVPGTSTADMAAIAAYADRLAPVAKGLGVELGEPRFDDDGWAEKLDAVAGVPVVSFTFGCPDRSVVERMQSAGSAVALTVTTLHEARAALETGPDLLWLQGAEAGAHRGSFTDDPPPAVPLAELVTGVRAMTELPIAAAGGLMDGADVRRVLAAGATWAAMGTAFLGCPEAGTSATHRAALTDPHFTETAVTRAFTGRPARGILNDFIREHDAFAPRGYPEVHHLTRPIRTAAAAAGDPEHLHLWAGEGWQRLRPMPAAELVATIRQEFAAG